MKIIGITGRESDQERARCCPYLEEAYGAARAVRQTRWRGDFMEKGTASAIAGSWRHFGEDILDENGQAVTGRGWQASSFPNKAQLRSSE